MGLDRLTVGVVRVLMVMLTGVKMLVGVSPVRPSIKESKLSCVKTLVGVSIGTPSMLRRFWALTDRLRLTGREGRLRLAVTGAMVVYTSWASSTTIGTCCCCSNISAVV